MLVVEEFDETSPLVVVGEGAAAGGKTCCLPAASAPVHVKRDVEGEG